MFVVHLTARLLFAIVPAFQVQDDVGKVSLLICLVAGIAKQQTYNKSNKMSPTKKENEVLVTPNRRTTFDDNGDVETVTGGDMISRREFEDFKEKLLSSYDKAVADGVAKHIALLPSGAEQVKQPKTLDNRVSADTRAKVEESGYTLGSQPPPPSDDCSKCSWWRGKIMYHRALATIEASLNKYPMALFSDIERGEEGKIGGSNGHNRRQR